VWWKRNDLLAVARVLNADEDSELKEGIYTQIQYLQMDSTKKLFIKTSKDL
jgi:hypothetical protein